MHQPVRVFAPRLLHGRLLRAGSSIQPGAPAAPSKLSKKCRSESKRATVNADFVPITATSKCTDITEKYYFTGMRRWSVPIYDNRDGTQFGSEVGTRLGIGVGVGKRQATDAHDAVGSIMLLAAQAEHKRR